MVVPVLDVVELYEIFEELVAKNDVGQANDVACLPLLLVARSLSSTSKNFLPIDFQCFPALKFSLLFHIFYADVLTQKTKLCTG